MSAKYWTQEDQRREQRVQRDARQQQHVCRKAPVSRDCHQVDDQDRAERAEEAGRGTVAHAAARRAADVRTSIAPSAAPAEMPSVKGVASGLRSSAWNTTPDEAERPADERRRQDARQARDEKDLGVDVGRPGRRQSKARDRRIDVPPASGARRQRPQASGGRQAATVASRALGRHGARRDAADSVGHHRAGAGRRSGARPRGEMEVGADAVQRRDRFARQHLDRLDRRRPHEPSLRASPES